MIKERTVLICGSKQCAEKCSLELIEYLERLLIEKKLTSYYKIERIHCQHLHEYGPIAIIQPDNILYTFLNQEKVNSIIETHIINNEIIEYLLFIDPNTGTPIKDPEEVKTIVKTLKNIENK